MRSRITAVPTISARSIASAHDGRGTSAPGEPVGVASRGQSELAPADLADREQSCERTWAAGRGQALHDSASGAKFRRVQVGAERRWPPHAE
jgi:hypothetical protein